MSQRQSELNFKPDFYLDNFYEIKIINIIEKNPI